MPRIAKPLSDAALRAAKPREKPYKLFDGGGPYIEVQPCGSRLWRLKYRHHGKEKRMAFGRWPEFSLAEARRLLAIDADPARPQRSSAPTFAEVAAEWMARHLATKADAHRVRVFRRLHRDILPFVGERPVDAITAPQVLAVVRQIEAGGAIETAHRALQNIGEVLRYAVATGRADPVLQTRVSKVLLEERSGCSDGRYPPRHRVHRRTARASGRCPASSTVTVR